MKVIRQVSTDKIVFRENPHTDKTIENAVIIKRISLSDLEVVDRTLTEDEWTKALYDQLSYSEKRKEEYDKLNQFEMQFDDQRDETTTWVDTINAIKDKHPKRN